MSIGIVTDSTSDLPTHLLGKYGIQSVPAVLVIGGESFLDGAGLGRDEFYQRLPRMADSPTTAAPAVGEFEQRYRNLITAGIERIVSVHAASTLSGIYNSARLAAQSFEGRVEVIDSGQLSLGLGFQVLAGAEAAAAGADLAGVLAAIRTVRETAVVSALLDTLEYLRRSGRVSWARARVADMLQLKPLIDLKEGQVIRVGQARTGRQGMQRLAEMLRAVGPLKRLAVMHTGAEPRAQGPPVAPLALGRCRCSEPLCSPRLLSPRSLRRRCCTPRLLSSRSSSSGSTSRPTAPSR